MDLDALAAAAEDNDVKPPTSAPVKPAPVKPFEFKPTVSEALIAERGDWRNFDLFLRAQSAWKAATEEIEADAEFKSCMINLHLGFRTLTKDQLRGHITYFEQLFTSFASKIDEFNSLGTSDQGWIYQSS